MTQFHTAVIICGDRNWTDQAAVDRVVRQLAKGTVVIHGAAPGADTMAGLAAHHAGLPYVEVPYFGFAGRSGGPQRNTLMLRILQGLSRCGSRVKVIAFHDNLEGSKGTKHMVGIARRAGISVSVRRHRVTDEI